MYNGHIVERQYCVYILTNKNHTVLYTGVTSDLKRRITEHKEKLVRGFSRKYNLDILVYYEIAEEKESAVAREKQIKAGSRQRKIDLIDKMNPSWKDLYDEL